MSQKDIRATLQKNPDGLTVTQLARRMEKNIDNTYKQIKETPGVYIRRWEVAPRRSGLPYVPVYMVVVTPSDAPMPD